MSLSLLCYCYLLFLKFLLGGGMGCIEKGRSGIFLAKCWMLGVGICVDLVSGRAYFGSGPIWICLYRVCSGYVRCILFVLNRVYVISIYCMVRCLSDVNIRSDQIVSCPFGLPVSGVM